MELWLKLIEDRLGPGHSLYERIAAYGEDRATEFLWQRAQPTCFFQGRDHERFGINVTELTLVRLPVAQHPADEPIRTRLAKRFTQLAGNCHIDAGGPHDREISVCRINAGWVIGIEHANHALLLRYAQAASHHHPPHLLGIVPDSLHGAGSRSLMDLLHDRSVSQVSPNGKE